MSEILIKWLNEEIHLSKEITNISEDFKTGYLFAELLYKTNQLQNITHFKNSTNKKDILRNFCILVQSLLNIGIIMTQRDRDEIMKGNIYTSKIFLLKIKQLLNKKFINLEQLSYKHSNDLQKLYNQVLFKNKNEKYLHNLKLRLQTDKNDIENNQRAVTEINEENINNKYDIGGALFHQLKKKYSHLNLSDNEIEMILLDMKEEEQKYKLLRDMIKKTENSRKNQKKSNEKQELKIWKSSIIDLNNFKKNALTELWKPILNNQRKFKLYMKKQNSENKKITENFDKNLNLFPGEIKEENNEDQEENKKLDFKDLQKSLQLKNEIYMSEIKKKLEQKIKSKKDKEKRERKRLREEREMYERMNTEKNMDDMINKMENNLGRKKKRIKDDNQFIDLTEQLLNKVSPLERQRIKDVDELVIKELNKENKKDEEKNENQKVKLNKIDMNVTKLLKKKNNKDIIKEIEENKMKDEQEIPEENKEINDNIENKEVINGNLSSYSKLSSNDHGLNLINEAFELHNNKKDFQNRIKLFKTRLLSTKDSQQKSQNLPDIFNFDEEDNSKSEQKPEKIKVEPNNINNLNDKETKIFDKELFYEEINKLNYENFLKESKKRKAKKEAEIKIIKPILDQLLDVTDYIYDYQQTSNSDLIDNELWDLLMDRLQNMEKIKNKEEIIEEEKEDISEYLFDYGYKLDNNDTLMIFDYSNYLSVFNDLIIPEKERGYKFKYCELYEEFYNSSKQDADIKEYEPKEDEIENLTLPKNPNFNNYKFFEIIETSFKQKYNQMKNNNNIKTKNEIFKQKGKYFYIPIKLCFCGYPLSGKKVQSNLIHEKYPGIKIFDPDEILEKKLEEYKTLNEPVENSTKNKNLKPNQIELLNKEREEKLEKFKPIIDILKPYLDYIDEYNNSNNEGMNLNLHETNFKEDILTDIYINLLIWEIDQVFPEEEKNKFMENINAKYQEYISIKEQINEIKQKEEESLKELNDKNANRKLSQNYSKDLETLNKKIEIILPELYVGFIFINFPKNEKQAKKLENKISGFISDFEKPKEQLLEKIFSYENILDINIKSNTKKVKQISMFDSFINLIIDSEEADRRFKACKYDPSTNKVYNMEDNPPNDKKILEKLIPGIPGFDDKKLNNEKKLYEKNKSGLSNFYKMMSNGKDRIYNNVEQMSKNLVNNINKDITNIIDKIIFENYYENIDLIINLINDSNNKEALLEEKNIVNESKNQDIKEEQNNENNDKKEQENVENKNEQNIQKSDEQNNLNNIEEKIINLKENPNEIEINLNIYNISEDISSQFELFATDYLNNLTNFIHFTLRQKSHIEEYLTKIQEDFILHLNRKTDKESITNIYVKKYNTIMNTQPHLLKSEKIVDDLLNNIEDVAKSIWLTIQNKKNEDIKWLNDIKGNGKINLELKKFWEFVLKVIENEVNKYLITCEIIIKYYLNLSGYLSDILENSKINLKSDKPDEYLFKINYSDFLYIGTQNSDMFNNINFFEEDDEKTNNENPEKEEEKKEENEVKEHKGKEQEKEKSMEEENIENKSNIDEEEINKTNYSIKFKNEKIVEENIKTLFLNALKIIIRQDLLMKPFKEKIKNYYSHENNKIHKNSNVNRLNTSIISTSSSKKGRGKSNKIEYEEFLNLFLIEKNKFKYRMMFIKNYIIKYFKILFECYNTTYNSMDDWIIMSVRYQNNSLNDFVSYLKKAINKKNKNIELDNFEFDSFDIYKKHIINISSIFDKLNLNSYIDLNKIENEKEKDQKSNIVLVNINDKSYQEKFVYNINDLMLIYKYLKSFGNEGCDYLIKYEIVKEILIHKCFSKKKYEPQPDTKDNLNKISSNPEQENIKINFEDNDGIPLIIKFLSNINYINCLDCFSEYNNNYININDLFTCLILVGSEIITSDRFIENIKEQINKENNIYLSKEEFLNLKLWFDEDKYLNSFVDSKEELFFNNNKGIDKIKIVKSSIFEINEEEGKIPLDKIINLLNKFNKTKLEEKSDDEDDDQIELNKENIEESEQKEQNPIYEDNNIIENKEEENNKTNNNIIEEDKKDVKEENGENSKNEIDTKSNINDNKESKIDIKMEEMTSQKNESELEIEVSNRKNGKNEDIKNNFFNNMFYN